MFSKNSTKPSFKVFTNSGVNPQKFIDTFTLGSISLSPTRAPVEVFSIFLVSSTSVKYPSSLTAQIPLVTPPLSLKVFFKINPAIAR